MIRKLFQGGETETESKKRRVWIEQLNRDILTFQMKVLIDGSRADMPGLSAAIEKYTKTLPKNVASQAAADCLIDFCLLVAESEESFSMWQDDILSNTKSDNEHLIVRLLNKQECVDNGALVRWINAIYYPFNWRHFKMFVRLYGGLTDAWLEIIKHANWEECTVSEYDEEVGWLVKHFRETEPGVVDAINERFRLQTERTPFQEMTFQMKRVIRYTNAYTERNYSMYKIACIIDRYYDAKLNDARLNNETLPEKANTNREGWFQFCASVAMLGGGPHMFAEYDGNDQLIGFHNWADIVTSGLINMTKYSKKDILPIRGREYEVNPESYTWWDIIMPRLLTMENISNGVLEYWAGLAVITWKTFGLLVDTYPNAPIAAWYELLQSVGVRARGTMRVTDKRKSTRISGENSEKYVLQVLEKFKHERFLVDRIIEVFESRGGIITPAISKWKHGVPRIYSNTLGRDVTFNFQ